MTTNTHDSEKLTLTIHVDSGHIDIDEYHDEVRKLFPDNSVSLINIDTSDPDETQLSYHLYSKIDGDQHGK